LRFAHNLKELHEVNFLKDIKKPRYSARELETAEALIEDMSAKWMPEKYKDTYYDDVMKVIKEKIKHGAEYVLPEPEAEESAPAPVTDLLPLLRKSLEAKKSGAQGKKPKAPARNYH
jgi:DNA end-binding protein Ku